MAGVENSDRGGRPAEAGALRILCAGISVVDEVFHVENFPPPDGKAAAWRYVLPLSLSWDHRVIDGASAARFNTHFAALLADMRRVLV